MSKNIVFKNIMRLFKDSEYRDDLLDYLIQNFLIFKAKLLLNREKRYIDNKKIDIIYSNDLLEYIGAMAGALRLSTKEIIVDPNLKEGVKDFVIGHEAYHLLLGHKEKNGERDLKNELEADLMSAKKMVNDLGYTKKEVIKSIKDLLVYVNKEVLKENRDNKKGLEFLMGEYEKDTKERIKNIEKNL